MMGAFPFGITRGIRSCRPVRAVTCIFLLLLVLLAAPARAAAGHDLFLKHCALCHGKDGKAQNPAARKLGVKDLSQSKASDAEIQKQILEGKKDDRGNLKMPPFKDRFTAEELQSLLGTVKSFRK